MNVCGLFCLLAVMTGVGASASRDPGHPVPSRDIEYALQCPSCYTERKGTDGRFRCVRQENCCLPLELKINCLVNPCLFFKRTCREAAYCVAVPCGPDYCTNELYDANFDLIDFNYCNKTSTRGRKRVSANRAKRIILVRRAQTQPSIIRNLPVFDRTPLHLKPGGCSQRRELIKLCVNECTYDRDCPGREKCCSNGCARRCTKPIPHHPYNYMNFPITVAKQRH
ncbi:hypothetical protein QR680_004650 [Steinernema hermaphroditum]|uniref:WAP domain-containing protein n=1 Tax=Steinernema hermaphroditum TaxID=289476 RepID=A0AA39LUB7_9BILA|nr:hypothetical protein QR680_004650 [Steinernema hermaphroditum]